MWHFTLLYLAGLSALVLQGAISTIVPPPWSPDLGLLVVISIALRWQTMAPGLLLASMLGLSADVLSASLTGQHLLLRAAVFAAVFLVSRQLNLKGTLPLLVLVAAASFLHGVAVYLFAALFGGHGVAAYPWLIENLFHALVNSLIVPGVFSAVSWLAIRAGADDHEERALQIEASRSSM